MSNKYAVIQRWKDNPKDFSVMDYFESLDQCQTFIDKQKKSNLFNLEIAKYE